VWHYSINLLHEKLPPIFSHSRLIKRLNGDGSYFLIHVDERQDYLYRELAQLTAGHPNIRMASKRQVDIG
jgi:hypothetical protein